MGFSGVVFKKRAFGFSSNSRSNRAEADFVLVGLYRIMAFENRKNVQPRLDARKVEIIVAQKVRTLHCNLRKTGYQIQPPRSQFELSVVMDYGPRSLGHQINSRVGIVDVAIVPFPANATVFDIQEVNFHSIQDFFQSFHRRVNTKKSVKCPSKR